MDTKKITLSGLLFALGFIMHQVILAPIGGITFDVQLSILFIVILINGTFKGAVSAGIVSGIITSLTTKFPGGQIPNLIDKIVTAILIYFVMTLLLKFANNIATLAIIGFFGTMISGCIFLVSAFYIVSLPAGLTLGIGFLTVVLPTSLVNMVATPILYKVISRSAKVARIAL